METAPLKSFATWARKELIREVTARIAVVLAPVSAHRVEQPKAVEALDKAVTAGGGGDKGRAAVADKVAYTWFNRIIALRFMDANGYTSVGVVSPQADVETGQPEVLAEAKRGNIDTGVVAGKTRETVTSLLNGTRRSVDAQGEAYALLLADYCRHWNRAMPFMFEREGDFTELLIPATLLADDSVPSRAVKVLTKDVCHDVEVIGWLYQFYISERKDEVFAGFKKNRKAGAEEIPAATQLFTPHWIVRYLVENSLGRLWMLNRPVSRLVDQMDYYIAPVDEQTDFLKISRPEELRVVDPACGSGHMLTYAFDLLYAIYEEEGYAPAEIPSLILTNNLHGIEIDPRAGALAAFALTMKARAKQRTFFNKQVEPNVCVLEPISFTIAEIDSLLTRGGDMHAEAAFWNQFEHADTFGSLIRPDVELTARLKHNLTQLDHGGDILLAAVLHSAGRVLLQAELLSSRYSVVVANPPYMGSRGMNARLTDFAKSEYPDSKPDLYSMFIERNLALASPGGMLGMITMQSWMFLSTFATIRQRVLSEFCIATLAHLGAGAFDTISGEVVATAAFVIRVAQLDVPGVYLNLTAITGERRQADAARQAVAGALGIRHEASSADLGELPLSSMAYWLTPAERHIYRDHPRLATLAETRQGLATGDNNRFLRFWWEVSVGSTCRDARSGVTSAASGAMWFPVQKGGTPRRWVGNDELVVNWEGDGAALYEFRPRSVIRNPSYYFREGATWSSLSGEFAVRYSPSGYVFESKGSMLFPLKNDDLWWLLGYLNTPMARQLIDSLSPTLDYHEGPVGRIPVVIPEDPTFVRDMVVQAVDLASSIWAASETSPGFTGLRVNWAGAARLRDELALLRGSLLRADELVLELERKMENHFRVSGNVGENVFPLRSQRPTGLIEPRLTNETEGTRGLVEDFVSFAIGCIFGRYSLDQQGLILADQGATVQDYLAKVPNPTFPPDKDNVIPIVDGDWFEDDVVARFRTFLRVAFGEQYFEENLRFVSESLGVRDIRDYFVKSFYKDHVQRYKKRPIYWLFSSPKGSFNALIYMHRYTPSTVSTVLNEYLREFTAKLSSSLQQQERLAAGGGTPRQQAAAQKEADRLRKVLLELEEYEHDVLYPLASRQLDMELDDGVKANYPKFGAALKKIPGLEASDE